MVRVVLSKTALQTAALTFSDGVYDMRIIPPVGEPYYLVKGKRLTPLGGRSGDIDARDVKAQEAA